MNGGPLAAIAPPTAQSAHRTPLRTGIGLNNTTSTLVLLEVGLSAAGGMELRFADDEGGDYSWSPRAVTEPLSLRELIRSIDSAEGRAQPDFADTRHLLARPTGPRC